MWVISQVMNMFSFVLQEPSTDHPVLAIELERGKNPFTEYKRLVIYAFRKEVCSANLDSGVTIGTALDALSVVYYLFDVQAHPNTKRTIRYLSEIIHQLPGLGPPCNGMDTIHNVFCPNV